MNFREMSITLDWIQISTMLHGHAEMATRPKVETGKLIRVTSSNKRQKHKCVDLSDYNIYLNQIRYTAQIPYYQHVGMAKFT